jgi:hypothetical protein
MASSSTFTLSEPTGGMKARLKATVASTAVTRATARRPTTAAPSTGRTSSSAGAARGQRVVERRQHAGDQSDRGDAHAEPSDRSCPVAAPSHGRIIADVTCQDGVKTSRAVAGDVITWTRAWL